MTFEFCLFRVGNIYSRRSSSRDYFMWFSLGYQVTARKTSVFFSVYRSITCGIDDNIQFAYKNKNNNTRWAITTNDRKIDQYSVIQSLSQSGVDYVCRPQRFAPPSKSIVSDSIVLLLLRHPATDSRVQHVASQFSPGSRPLRRQQTLFGTSPPS